MVRYIDLEDCEIPLPENEGNFQVVVRDVSLGRPTLSVQLGLPSDVSYWTTDDVVDFCSGINDCAARPSGSNFHLRGSGSSLEKESRKGHYSRPTWQSKLSGSFFDERISARRGIEQSIPVISMPFSSPSIISDRLGKPSAFFDPTQSVKIDDIDSIPVLGCVEEVYQWLRGLTTHSADRKQVLGSLC